MPDRFADEQWLRRRERRDDPAAWTAHARDGMVATAHYRATLAGAEVLGDGGNAVDAAIAASFALGVCEPEASGIGGMATMLVHMAAAERTTLIAGPCRAPRLATPERVGARRRRRGALAIAVPGALAALQGAHERYGSLPLARLLEPAIGLAEDGYTVSETAFEQTRRFRRSLTRETGGAVFLTAEGAPHPVGSIVRQPALARTLRRLARNGLDDFYRGELAREIDADMRRQGAFLRGRDLAQTHPAADQAPLWGRAGSRTIASAGVPAGGDTLLQILQLHTSLPASLRNPDTPQGAVALAATIRAARRDRQRFRLLLRPGRPAPFLEETNLREQAALVRAAAGTGETSHLVTADREGNVVSLTQSIERVYGSKVITPELGFLYNGYIRAFKTRNQRHPHYLRPGGVARSNAAPSIAFEAGRVTAAVGATGSERMASTIAQVLLRLERADPFNAVAAPRLHCTPDGTVFIEDRVPAAVIDALREAGFDVQLWEPYSFLSGGLQLLTIDAGGYTGVGEPRRDGAAAGPAHG